MGLSDLIRTTLEKILDGGDVEGLGEYLAALYVRLDWKLATGDVG